MANCNNCGFRLEKMGNFCPSCGTSIVLSNNKDTKIKKILMVVVLLLFGLMTYFIGLSALQNNRMNKMNIVSQNNIKTIDKYSDRIDELESALDENQTSLQSIRDETELYRYKSDFMDENIALIVDNSNQYHTSDCSVFREADTYCIYSVDDAIKEGYTVCEICHKKN